MSINLFKAMVFAVFVKNILVGRQGKLIPQRQKSEFPKRSLPKRDVSLLTKALFFINYILETFYHILGFCIRLEHGEEQPDAKPFEFVQE